MASAGEGFKKEFRSALRAPLVKNITQNILYPAFIAARNTGNFAETSMKPIAAKLVAGIPDKICSKNTELIN